MKIKSYKKQLWMGQKQKTKKRFVLTNICTNRHHTNQHLQYIPTLSPITTTHALEVARKITKVSLSTTSSRNFITILSDSALFGNTAIDSYILTSSLKFVSGCYNIIIIIINPLTTRVVGAPQMILQPVFSIFSTAL